MKKSVRENFGVLAQRKRLIFLFILIGEIQKHVRVRLPFRLWLGIIFVKSGGLEAPLELSRNLVRK